MPWVSSIFTPEKQAEERMVICRACPHLNSYKLCDHCGCVMPLKVKLRYAACPELKWGPVNDDGKMHFVEDPNWDKE